MAEVRPYGSWKSPISSELIVAGTIRLSEVRLAGEETYWLEARPMERGRSVVVRRRADGSIEDVTPAGFNVRTRVHEYGGGAYCLDRGTVCFTNWADQQLYRHDPRAEPVALSNAPGMYFADPEPDGRGALYCVREDHTGEGEPVNTLVQVLAAGHTAGTVVAEGYDFYAAPRLSPDGGRIAWTCWNHPNLPWDGTELWVAFVAPDGSLRGARKLAGDERESIQQPEWSPEGELYFLSDLTGWWNLYRWGSNGAEPVCEMEAEFSEAPWLFAQSSYAFAGADRLIASFTRSGQWSLLEIDLRTGTARPVPLPYTSIAYVRATPERAVIVAGSATHPQSIVELELGMGATTVLKRSTELQIDARYLSVPEAIEFPTEDGLTAHALYYPPANGDFTAPEGERPPLIVQSHGGPTTAASRLFSLRIQYWTSRGIGFLDVDYGGSTGYGREYRERLYGRWGVVDVEDCVSGARFLAERGSVDRQRMAISGGSAGGYTTLCALTFRDVFRAGASHFGLSDLEAFVGDTHKFEARYLDRLIGPFPERRDLYRERSPIHYTDRLSCPIIFFQGLEDKVVPPSQTEMMVEALRRKRLPVAYLAFEGEQHGFRQAANIRRSLDGELYFYSRVFGFELAEPVEPVAIENMPAEPDAPGGAA